MPLPGTRMVPGGWSKHHQASVETAMRSRVDILAPLGEAPPPIFGEDPAEGDGKLVTNVRARIRALAHGNDLAPSGQDNDHQSYLVQVPARALPSLLVGDGGHRLRVTENPELPGLVGQTMTIHGLHYGTEAFNIDLTCRVHVTQNQGS